MNIGTPLEKAALRGEPSYVWRAGQERRLQMMLRAMGDGLRGAVLENGCGVGIYVTHLSSYSGFVVGLERDMERAITAHKINAHILCAAGEGLPFADNMFDAQLSHEVIEHVQDDTQSVQEMVRVLKPAGKLVLFCPNRGYPFETHGVYWRGKYIFGNIPLVNYLPRAWRDKFAPHVRVYNQADVAALFHNLPVKVLHKSIVFGAYDNIIQRSGWLGKVLRAVLQGLENSPLSFFGLSHYWVVEKI